MNLFEERNIYLNIGSESYVRLQCRTCGSYFIVPTIVYEQHKYYGGYHQCHAGHGWGWTEEAAAENRKVRAAEEAKEKKEEVKENAKLLVFPGGNSDEEEKSGG